MRLIGSTTSPYVRKVRVYLEETGHDYEFTTVDAWNPEPSLLDLAPVGKVPVLVLDQGPPLFESNLCIEYLDSLLPDAQRLIPSSGEWRWQVLRLQALANGMIDATATRTVELRKPDVAQMKTVLDRETKRIDRILTTFERLVDPSHKLVGGRLSSADLVLGVALQYLDFRYTADWRKTAPRLAAWFVPMTEKPSFKTTLPPGFTPPA
ncbi:glutathione S-transferase family protein [Pseudorhodoplanes sp.]|uniref:glutathione S-transferase family protein n=1 Tax=Pseudorhodoplanes sp. TaxID=1934341 RepID=UPI002BD5A6AA|nr:glutathione S-transferase N-terminal domain-containing protein [Pseudorhodoplanes sp.]HWV55405.1 glutathione S-transferase N-terminal domain-containing protein [Pseudorhodoplanes sp.]